MRILWASRHPPLMAQLGELYEKFGDVEIIEEKGPFTSAEHVIELATRHEASIIVPILPLSFVARLCELAEREGITLLWAEMEDMGTHRTVPDVDIKRDVVLPVKEANGTITFKVMRFKGFKRIRAVRLELEPI